MLVQDSLVELSFENSEAKKDDWATVSLRDSQPSPIQHSRAVYLGVSDHPGGREAASFFCSKCFGHMMLALV